MEIKDTEKSEILVLIDSNAIIHRAYHALPKSMSNRAGVKTNVVYGYTTTLVKVLEDLKPKYIAASFDLAGPTFRHEVYKEYKATRVKADQDLYDQIPLVRKLLECLNIKVFEKSGFEADDCIGTIVEKMKDNKEIMVCPVSGDKDIFQLVNGNVKVYNLRHGLADSQLVDSEYIQREYKLHPIDFIDLKALAGDASDNIPGIPGIGPKTATELLQRFDNLENLYKKIKDELPEALQTECKTDIKRGDFDNLELDEIIDNRQKKITEYQTQIEQISQKLGLKPRILTLLVVYNQQAFLSKHLATIDRAVPLNFALEDVVWGNYDKEKLRDFFEELGFHSLLKRFGGEIKETPKTKQAKEQEEKDNQLRLL